MDRFQIIEGSDNPTGDAMAFLLPNGQRAMASTQWAVGQQGMPRQRSQTGSSATGSGSAGSGLVPPPSPPQRTGAPKLQKEVTAELGNVTPYIIVPGPWSDEDLVYHAGNVAAGLINNCGHNCLAAEVRAGAAFAGLA